MAWHRLKQLVRSLFSAKRTIPAGTQRRGYPDSGGAGVREPRQPRPSPLSGGAAAEPPRPSQRVQLPDARR